MATEAEIKKEMKTLSKFVHLKNKSEREIRLAAEESLRKKAIRKEFLSSYKDKQELEVAKNLVYKYLEDYQIESVSDRNNLKEVIRLEVIQNRLHDKMNEIYDNNNKALSLQTLDAIQKNADAIRKMKDTLGLNKAREKKPYDAFQHLMRRAKTWLENNQMSRTRKCPHCQKYIWFKMRTEAWEALKHPFFKDNIIYNKALFEKYYGKTVTVDDQLIADVLEVSKDFPGWVREKRLVAKDVQTETE